MKKMCLCVCVFRTMTGCMCQRVISNKQLYEKTGERPISSIIREARWELFDHILNYIPAYKAMELYIMLVTAKGFRGQPRTNLPKH